MIGEIPLSIRATDEGIEFVFENRTSFATLIVTTHEGDDELWQLKPAGMAQESTGGPFASLPIDRASETDIEVLSSFFKAEPRSGLPSCDRVVYGQVPEGFAEVEQARPLVPGKRYAVIVMSARHFATREFVA